VVVDSDIVEVDEARSERKIELGSALVKQNTEAPDGEAGSGGKSRRDCSKWIRVSRPARMAFQLVNCRGTTKEYRVVVSGRIPEVQVPTWSASATPAVVTMLPFKTSENTNGLPLESGDDRNSSSDGLRRSELLEVERQIRISMTVLETFARLPGRV
jgi:hypothetical protein